MKKSEANIEDLRNQTVSWGTHRPDDLIPKFMAVLKEYGKEAYDKYVSENPEVEDWKMLDDETKGWVVDELFDLLDGIAPEDCYFGAHPDDGADFGFWQVDESKKNEAKYDGPITLYGSTRYDDAEEAQKFLDGISGGQVKVSKDRNGDMLIVSIAGSDEDIDAFLEVYKDNYDNFETDCDANVMGWTSPGDLPYLTVQGRKELTGESKKSDGLADGDAALLKMQKSLKQYADKTTGEIAADIRYDVATALDMPADEVDDVMLNFGLDNIYILRSKGLSPKEIAQKILKSTKSKKSEAMQNEGWTGGFSSRQEILDLMDGGIFTDDWKLEKRFGNWGCYVNQKTGRPIVLQMLIEPDNDHGWAYKPVTSDMGPYDINIQAAKWLKPRLEKWVEENPDKSKDVPGYEWEWIEKCLGKAAATKSKKDIAASLVKGDKVKLIDTVANGAVVTFIEMMAPGKMRILHNGREMSCKTSYIDRKVDAPAESKKSEGYADSYAFRHARHFADATAPVSISVKQATQGDFPNAPNDIDHLVIGFMNHDKTRFIVDWDGDKQAGKITRQVMVDDKDSTYGYKWVTPLTNATATFTNLGEFKTFIQEYWDNTSSESKKSESRPSYYDHPLIMAITYKGSTIYCGAEDGDMWSNDIEDAYVWNSFDTISTIAVENFVAVAKEALETRWISEDNVEYLPAPTDTVESKKSESLTLKQKELKNMARYGEATDITTISDAEAKELKKKGIETVGISRGAYGMNGALLRDNEGNKYVITARSSNLFYFV